MKNIAYSILFVLCISSAPAQVDSLFAIVSDNTVTIWNINIEAACESKYELNTTIVNDTIFITELDTSTLHAYCLCYYNVSTSITGLVSGHYVVAVSRTAFAAYPGATTTFVGYTSFDIVISNLPFSQISSQGTCHQSVQSVDESVGQPRNFLLRSNYPNPFNPITTIEFNLPQRTFVTLKIYNTLGKEIATLVSQELTAGIHHARWEANGMSSGVYYYRITAGNFSDTKKLTVIK